MNGKDKRRLFYKSCDLISQYTLVMADWLAFGSTVLSTQHMNAMLISN